jgi:hypothetical protein
VCEHKKRVISAAPYSDRVVHHALVNVIEPIFERGMVRDSYANRVDRGTHRAVERFTEFCRKRRYVLKMDVVRFFPSVDHEILMDAVERKIKDEDVLWLIRIILDSGREPGETDCVFHFPGDDLFTPLARRRGLPIGNLTSQFLANVYLDRFDHYVKENLRCRYYVRYMDDMVIFDDSKARLREVRAAMIEALGRLRLKVHLNKAQIWPVRQGTDWLGYRVYPAHRRVRRSNIRRFRRKLKELASAYGQSLVGIEKVKASIMSWIAHVSHADSYRLRQNLLKEVSFHRG